MYTKGWCEAADTSSLPCLWTTFWVYIYSIIVPNSELSISTSRHVCGGGGGCLLPLEGDKQEGNEFSHTNIIYIKKQQFHSPSSMKIQRPKKRVIIRPLPPPWKFLHTSNSAYFQSSIMAKAVSKPVLIIGFV